MGALFGEDMTRGVSWFHRKLEDIKAKFEETGDYKQLYETLDWVGLSWKSEILNFIDPLLWGSRKIKERRIV